MKKSRIVEWVNSICVQVDEAVMHVSALRNSFADVEEKMRVLGKSFCELTTLEQRAARLNTKTDLAVAELKQRVTVLENKLAMLTAPTENFADSEVVG